MDAQTATALSHIAIGILQILTIWFVARTKS